MEEYKFNSENNYIPEEKTDSVPVAETSAAKKETARIIIEDSDMRKPKKKGVFKRALSGLCSFILIVGISVSGGLIGAHFMVENKFEELDEYYGDKYADFVSSFENSAAVEDVHSAVLSLNENAENKEVLESIVESQKEAAVKTEQLATIISKSSSTSTYATVAAAVKDSVVEITTEMASNSLYFQQFVQSGAGSGVIISEDGYIITNHHVIDGATKITVRLTTGEEFVAEIIGSDAQSDIAVLKITAETKLPFAVIGNSEKIAVGEEVLAIGNPLGELGGSVTNGIISALDRELTIDGQTMRLLQTNAAINPGNSGGGLFNMKGELIAIVNAKSSGTGIEGLGFAIPINYAYEIAAELLTNGYVSGRPAIGISYIEISNYMDLISFGVSNYGIYVYDGGETSLKNGDRIISLGEYEVSDSATLKNAIQQYKVGDKVEIMVARGGKFSKVEVTLVESKPAENTEPKLEISK